MSHYEQLKQDLGDHPHTWLVTGVAGFIGSHLLETLLQLNQKVIGVDNFSTGSERNLQDVLSHCSPKEQGNFQFFQHDICDHAESGKWLQGVDYVLHQAALGSVPRSIKAPEATHAANVNGFLNVLVAAKDAQVKRFVYASSSSVYGDSSELPKQEKIIGNPLSPYAVTKYTNELYAKTFGLCYGLETIGLRYFNVFGSRQDPNGPYAAVIPRWILALLKKEPVYINGDGETSRDFCYVKNAVQANLLAATSQDKQSVHTVYNVAVGQQNTLKTLYALLVEYLGLDQASSQLQFKDFREGDIRHSLASIDKAKQYLNYSPTHTLNAGLKEMLGWYTAYFQQ